MPFEHLIRRNRYSGRHRPRLARSLSGRLGRRLPITNAAWRWRCRRSDLLAAFEGLASVEAVVAARLRHYLASLPIAHHPADVFARDPGQVRQVALADLLADHDPPRPIGFAEKLPRL